MITLGQFVAKYNGVAVDFDRAYGGQCWDLVAQYSQEVVGLQGGAWDVMPTGPLGGAVEIYTVFKNPLPTYYDRIANSPDPNQLPLEGDIIVWNWGTYGHTAICLGATSASISVFEENSPVGSAAHVTPNKTWSGCVGWIRPKVTQGVTTMFNNIAEVEKAYVFLRGRAGTQAEMQEWVGKPILSFFSVGLGEANAYRSERDSLRSQLVSVQTALVNEQNKPPVQIIKEVEKIVEVIKEVPTPIDEKAVVGNILGRVWRSLVDWIFKKGNDVK